MSLSRSLLKQFAASKPSSGATGAGAGADAKQPAQQPPPIVSADGKYSPGYVAPLLRRSKTLLERVGAALSSAVASLDDSGKDSKDGKDKAGVPLEEQPPPRELLATCADDKTVMLWNPDTWQLYHVLRSSEVAGWHTFT